MRQFIYVKMRKMFLSAVISKKIIGTISKKIVLSLFYSTKLHKKQISFRLNQRFANPLKIYYNRH